MPWKTINGRRYYFGRHRRGGRVVETCFGSGELAIAMASVHALEAEARRAEADWRRESRAAERDRLDGLEGPFDRWSLLVEGAAGAVLEGAGFHRPKRGPWRLRRMKTGTIPDGGRKATDEVGRADLEELCGIVRRACAGDRESRDRIAAEFRSIRRRGDEKQLAALIRLCDGDPADTAEESLFALFGSDDGGISAMALRQEIARVRRALVGPDPMPMEDLLARRAALGWLAVNHAEAVLAQNAEGMTPAAGDYWQRRCTAAHRRLLSSLRTLATVRRLLGPPAAMNVNKTVNLSVLMASSELGALPDERIEQPPGRG